MSATIPSQSTDKVTVERRGQVVLIGINRPSFDNRIDPDTFSALARAYFDYDNDSSVRAAVLFGHGPSFSRGIDVDAYSELARSGRSFVLQDNMTDPLATGGRLQKPLIVATHGDTWNMAHELHLVGDIRVTSRDAQFGQDEASHGRFPGGGSTVRFVREVGWANAMRYMLTGDHWDATEAFRMGEVQFIADDAQGALDMALQIASRVAQCAPLGVTTTLASAHLAIDKSESEALGSLSAQYGALYRTKDFVEGREAEAQGRPPHFQGR
jgi:enoyl-CoA hydratase